MTASYSVTWMLHNLLVVLLSLNFMFLLFPPCCSTSFCIAFSFLFQAYLGFHWDQFVCYRNHPGWTAAEKQVKCFFFSLTSQPFNRIVPFLSFYIKKKKKVFWPCCVAWGILVPWPGIEPVPLPWKRGVLTTGPPGKSWIVPFLSCVHRENICVIPVYCLKFMALAHVLKCCSLHLQSLYVIFHHVCWQKLLLQKRKWRGGGRK